MAAPPTTARLIPSGWKMPDGFKTTVAFAIEPGVWLWEKSVTAPGVDGGEGIDTTTMLNTAWRTKDARQLKTLTDFTMKTGYDPDVYITMINTLVNRNGGVTVHFPDHSTLDFWGYVSKFIPDALEEGKFPEASTTVVVTNWDAVLHVEAAPVFTAATGT